MPTREAPVLAHVTQSRMRAALDDPVMADFAFAFDAVSRAARGAPGFVWQLQAHAPGHPVLSVDDPLLVLSVSVWQDYSSLHGYVFGGLHGRALLRRSEWFVPVPQPSTALWWTAPSAMPTAEHAAARLARLRRAGPSPAAFGLRRRFDPDGRPVSGRRRRD